MGEDALSRRRFVALSGTALSASLLAGCGEGGAGAEESPDGGGGESPAADEGEATAQTAGQQEQDLVELEPWRDVEAIELEGVTEAWNGVSPDPIEGQNNPAIVLIEGKEYTVNWTNGDGAPHDFTLWDENQEEIDSTDAVESEGEGASLTFEATPDIAQYVCTVHPDTMIGDVQVVSENTDSGTEGTDGGGE